MYYIQETDKPSFILNMFNIIKLSNDKIVLPIKEKEQLSQKKAQKLAKKTNMILEKVNCKKIIISKEIKKQEQYLNYLNTYNCNIVDGKWLFELLSEEILNYIINTKKIEKENIQLSILVNDLSDAMLNIIKRLANQYKKINIVTNHIEKFKKIEENMLEKHGIVMIVNNNKKKSLAKSQLILNVDFPSELINKYNIYDEAIIININNNVKINKKRYNGININDYEIEFKEIIELDYEKTNHYNAKDIYEAQFYKKQPFENIMKKMKIDKVTIKKLFTTNGTI